jgi:TatD DNase family protein
LIDLHCHIDLYPDPRAVLDQAEARGVYILAVTTTPKSWSGTRKLIGNRQRIRMGLGLHPELVAERHSELPLFAYLLGETRYVGEIGLDGGPHMRGSFRLQESILDQILQHCSAAGGRILSLHSRRAAGAVLDCLSANPGAGVPVLHWFSGSRKELDRAIALGCWFSVGPLMLASAKGRALVEAIPKERVLTETDAPFARLDGSPLMPWDVDRTYPYFAEMWGCALEAVPVQMRTNLMSLLESSGSGGHLGTAD